MRPFRLCRLTIPVPESKNQDWVIKFNVWDEQRRRLVLKREKDFNSKFKPGEEKQKLAHVKGRMRDIDIMLKEGARIDLTAQDPEAIEAKQQEISIDKMFDLVTERINLTGDKNRKTQRSIINHFKQWLKGRNLLNAQATEINKKDAIAYMDHLRTTPIRVRDKKSAEGYRMQKRSDRSIDNQKNGIRTAFNMAIKEPLQLIKVNPFEGISNINRNIGRNIAYTQEQADELIAFMEKSEPDILLRCIFMYQTLCRTGEMALVQKKHIGLRYPDKIFIPGAITKNGLDRHVSITDELRWVFEKLEIDKLPPDYYLFSHRYKPGPKPLFADKLGQRYRERVLNVLSYDEESTFYSWKHTGVVRAKQQGISDGDIMIQGGWKSVVSYNKYLKSLGLMDNIGFRMQHPPLLKMRVAN